MYSPPQANLRICFLSVLDCDTLIKSKLGYKLVKMKSEDLRGVDIIPEGRRGRTRLDRFIWGKLCLVNN